MAELGEDILLLLLKTILGSVTSDTLESIGNELSGGGMSEDDVDDDDESVVSDIDMEPLSLLLSDVGCSFLRVSRL